MADSKLSELTAATSAAAADSTYLVQSSTSKSITVQALFAAIATPTAFNDKVSIGDHNTMTAVGTISTDYNVTFINNPDAGGNCPIGAGLDGQIKIIDLNIEGISLIIAQREEFQSFLANNNYDLDKLIEKIISVSN